MGWCWAGELGRGWGAERVRTHLRFGGGSRLPLTGAERAEMGVRGLGVGSGCRIGVRAGSGCAVWVRDRGAGSGFGIGVRGLGAGSGCGVWVRDRAAGLGAGWGCGAAPCRRAHAPAGRGPQALCLPGVPSPRGEARAGLREQGNPVLSAMRRLSGRREEFKAPREATKEFSRSVSGRAGSGNPLASRPNTAVPVSRAARVKTRQCHGLTWWPCVLAAAGSSRFRRFNLSLGKADVSGSWRTWEVTTANSPRGSPGPGLGRAPPLRSQRGAEQGGRGRGRPRSSPPPPAPPGARRHHPAGPPRRERSAATVLRPRVARAVGQQPLTRAQGSSSSSEERQLLGRATRPLLLDFPNPGCTSLTSLANWTLQGQEGRNKS